MPEQLGRQDAVVENEDNKDARKAELRWEALQSFHRAPCFRPSITVGALGGVGIGALRFVGGAGGKAAFTWGSVVAGLLSGTSWFTCRRAYYARMDVDGEAALISRAQGGDMAALEKYQQILEEREAKMKANPRADSGSWARKA